MAEEAEPNTQRGAGLPPRQPRVSLAPQPIVLTVSPEVIRVLNQPRPAQQELTVFAAKSAIVATTALAVGAVVRWVLRTTPLTPGM